MNNCIPRSTDECGACFGTVLGVIEEHFTDRASALQRYSQLFSFGRAPSLCERTDGSYRVCHVIGPEGLIG